MVGTIIFTLVYLALMGVCLYLAYKRHWIKSALSLAVGAISLPEAYFLARGFVKAFGEPLSNALKEGFLELLNLRSDVMVRETAMLKVSAFGVTIILGMASFLVFFAILWAVNTLIKRLIFSKLLKKAEQVQPVLSVVFALLSFAVVSFAVLYPLGAVSDIAVSAAKNCGYKLPVSVMASPVGRLYGIAGRGFFDRLTKVGDEFVNSDEAERGAEIYISLKMVAEGKDEDGGSIERIAESMKSSYLLTDFSSELAANAANSWRNGRKFMNKTLKMPEGRNGELVGDILELVSGWQRDNLVQDIDTGINIYKLLKEHGILKVNDGAVLFEALSDREFDERLFAELSGNDDFIAVIPKVLKFGIGSAVDAMEMEMNDEYIVEFDAKSLTEEEWKKEAEAFSILLSRMKELSEESEGGSLDILGLLGDMYELRDSKILSNMLVNLIIQILYNMQLGAGL